MPARICSGNKTSTIYDEVSELLDDVVALGFLAFWKAQRQMLEDSCTKMPDLIARRDQSKPELTGCNAVGEIDEPVEHEDPGEQKVPLTPGREVLRRGQRQPGRKRPGRCLALERRDAEHAGRVEAAAGNCGDAALRIIVGRVDRQQWLVEGGDFAPVERWVSVENLQPAHQEYQETRRIQPMRRPDDQRVAEHPATPFHLGSFRSSKSWNAVSIVGCFSCHALAVVPLRQETAKRITYIRGFGPKALTLL